MRKEATEVKLRNRDSDPGQRNLENKVVKRSFNNLTARQWSIEIALDEPVGRPLTRSISSSCILERSVSSLNCAMLKVGLGWYPQRQVVEILVASACGLKGVNLPWVNDQSDPYVSISIFRKTQGHEEESIKEEAKFKTKTVWGNCNPEWNETFTFDLESISSLASLFVNTWIEFVVK